MAKSPVFKTGFLHTGTGIYKCVRMCEGQCVSFMCVCVCLCVCVRARMSVCMYASARVYV